MRKRHKWIDRLLDILVLWKAKSDIADEVRALKREKKSLKSEVESVQEQLSRQVDLTHAKEGERLLAESEIERLSIQVSELQVKLKVSQVEVAELSALVANRLMMIEDGKIDYREQDVERHARHS